MRVGNKRLNQKNHQTGTMRVFRPIVQRKVILRLQKEVRRQIPKTDCTAKFDEQTGYLNIDYKGTELLPLHSDDIILKPVMTPPVITLTYLNQRTAKRTM